MHRQKIIYNVYVSYNILFFKKIIIRKWELFFKKEKWKLWDLCSIYLFILFYTKKTSIYFFFEKN